MPNNDYLMDEKQIPENWVDSPRQAGPRVAPAPPAPNPMPGLFDGSLAPQIQQNVNYVGTTQASPQVPKYSLMPQGIQGSPSTNAAIESTIAKTVKPSTVTPTTATESVNVNVQSGTSYLVQGSDLDTLISMNNDSGGSIYLPPFNAPGLTYENLNQVFTPANGLSITQAITPTTQINQGDTIILTLAARDTTGTSLPGIVSVTDSNGNAYTLDQANFYVDFASRDDLVVCYSAIANANITTSDTLTITIDFVADTTPFNIVSFSIAGFYKKFATQHANGTVGGGMFSSGVGIIVSENSFFVSVVASTNTSTPDAPLNSIASGFGGNQIGVAYFYGTGSVTDTWTGSGNYADSLIAYQAPQPSGAISALTPGFFCWIENTGTGSFTVYSGAEIDGDGSFEIGPNKGVFLVWNGTGWYTERGLGLSAAILSINGDTTPAQQIFGGTNILVVTSNGTTTISEKVSGEPTVPFYGYPEATFVALNPTNSLVWNASPLHGSANKIIMFPFFMPYEIEALDYLIFTVLAADAGNMYDFGIYKDVSGQPAFICSTGPTTISSTSSLSVPTKLALANLSGGPLPAGLSYFAITSAGAGTLGILGAYDVWRSPWQYQDTSIGTGAWLSATTPSTSSTLPQATLTFGGTPTFLVNDSVQASPVFAISQ